MIGLVHGLKIFTRTEPTDMRRGFDGRIEMADSVMKQNPLSVSNAPFSCTRIVNELKTIRKI